MPQRIFYIDEAKQNCLSASWRYNWSNFELRFQDEVICSFVTKQELEAGRQFVMPDGHLLSVRLRGSLQPELELLRDGLTLPAKTTDSGSKQSIVLQVALVLAILNITGGIAAVATQSDILLSIGFGYGSMAIGVVYVLLAWGIRLLSSYAVYAIAALISLDIMLLFVFTAMMDGPTSPVSGILIKLFLVYAYIKGVKAIKKLKSQAAANSHSRQSIN